MKLKVNVVLVKSLIDLDEFIYKVDDNSYKIVRKRLESELAKIIYMLKIMQEQGEIKSVSKPRNKKIQVYLDNLVKAKKTIKHSISMISEIYYK